MRFKLRRRESRTSEATHMFRGVVGTLIVLGLLGWAFFSYGPVLIAKLPEEQKVAVKSVKTVPVKAGMNATRGPQ